MIRKGMILAGLLILIALLSGMGSLGGKPTAREKAPEPNERFDALIVDMEGMEIQVTYISYDGELYVPVYRGRALITIPFNNIDKIEMGDKENARRKAKISFKNRRTGEFLIDEGILFNCSSGYYRHVKHFLVLLQ